MRKALWALLLMGGTSVIKSLRTDHHGHMELVRLKMFLMYVRSIKTFRLLFMSLFSMGVCLILLFTGLILLYSSLFFYAPWSTEIKLLVGIFSSAIYLLASLALFSSIFSADKWLKLFNADGIMAQLKQQTSDQQKESEGIA